MTVLVTGSAGHLGEGLMRTLKARGIEARGLDVKPSAFTTDVGDITDEAVVRARMADVHTVYHTATLHKPHVATHSVQDFINTNISGTATLLEAAVDADVEAFVFTSTTSVFGDAMKPLPGEPAVWVTESVAPLPKNVYGVTKLAAENLCQLFHRTRGLNVMVLRTSRFFPEEDDDRELRDGWEQDNVKANEFLFRRVELADCVDAHLCAARRASDIGFDRFIVSATSPLRPEDLADLPSSPYEMVSRRCPAIGIVYPKLGWRLFDSIDRVYVNDAARERLGWQPRFDFAHVLDRLARGEDMRSELAIAVGKKGYHDLLFEDGPYPVDSAT